MNKEEVDACVALFVKNIYTVAEMKGYQIAYVERYAGVSAGYISRILKGVKGFSFRTAILLADAVGETLSDLMNKDYQNVAVEKQIQYLEERIQDLKSQLK